MYTNEGWTGVVFNNRDPVYLQVVRHFKEQIATGRMEAGQVIPSRRELAALLKINPNTAQRAYKEMEEHQLIVTEGNSPSRITTQTEVLRTIRSELIQDAVDGFIASIRKIEVPIDELLDLVERRFVEAKAGENKSESGGGGRHD
jgi:GntR family transcriptional regulator